jgi:uncharacterized protein (TIGR02145 family)
MFIKKRFFRAAGIAAVAAIFCIGCSEDNGGNPGSSGNGGGTVKIGGKTWMAKNLNIATANSKCYENSADSCAKYGRLYNWNDAKSACPSGWRLPSDADWTALTDAVGGESVAGKKLKSKSGWNYNGNGTDDYGFAALPAGYGDSDGSFGSAGFSGIWWSATEGSAGGAYLRSIDYDGEDVGRINGDKTTLFSVRCVQD